METLKLFIIYDFNFQITSFSLYTNILNAFECFEFIFFVRGQVSKFMRVRNIIKNKFICALRTAFLKKII
jgi:hypothetical protein